MKPKPSILLDELRRLTADDFDFNNVDMVGPEQLDSICERVSELAFPEVIFPEFFALMERLPDSELGMPGPLSHTMEQHMGQYEALLEESIRRRPTDLSL